MVGSFRYTNIYFQNASSWPLIFKEHVGRCSVKSIIRTAKERRPGVLGYAEVMLIAYNAKNKYCLPIKKLYGSQRDEELDNEESDDDSAAI